MKFGFQAVLVALVLAVPASAQSDDDWKRADAVEVRIKSFSFTPSVVHMKAGVPVRLTLVDEKGGHNFSAPEFFSAAQIAPEDRGKVPNGKVELEGGETLTIRIVPSVGTYKLNCTHLMHTSFGMKGKIVVEA